MALVSGILHVTKTRKLIVVPPVSGACVHLYTYNTEDDRPAYIGDKNVVSSSGVMIPSGTGLRLPYPMVIEPNAELYAVSDEGKDCWLGFVVTP